ncbi:MAG: DUF1080 domain-containing protein [Sediminibacterium sp.]|nr:DUF1080 domain-containing protein [Sediminibacterium sp.]
MKKTFLPFFFTKHICFLLMISFLLLGNSSSAFSAPVAEDQSVIGRWDLTVQMGDRLAPSWLEVKLSGIKTLVGYFVADGGSARPVAHVQVTDGKIHFAIPGQWDTNTRYMEFDAVLENDQLKGTITSTSGAKYPFTGVRAPLLKRTNAPVWGKPINLLNGKNTESWHASGSNNQWKIINGVLTSPQSGSNLITDQKFEDFKLHIEFRYPVGSNSGVYLRGRYEVQVEDNAGKEPSSTYFGGIYGFLTPNEMVAKPAGEWQTYDITLIGRRVTVVANGKTIIADQIIPGITGGALDSKEGESGPIMLQGDHGPVEYRNIIITPAK